MKRCLCIAFLLVAACHKENSDANKGPTADKATVAAAPSGKGSGGPVPVKIAQVEKKLAARIVYAVAPLEGHDQADVYSKVTGRITFLGAKEGEPVKVGQVLFRVDRSDPGETYLNAPVPSPIAGWIGRWRIKNIGEQVAPTDPVVTVVDDRTLKSIADLPADDWLEVTQATKVTAVVGSFSRVANIATIARSADLTSGRGSITLTLENPLRDLRAGMYARFKFELAPKERILLSAASLIITDQGAFVYVAEGDRARRVGVKFQVIDTDTVEITQGLDVKAKVITAGANLIGDKSQIKIVD